MTSSTTQLLDTGALEAAAERIAPLPAATTRLLAIAGAPDVTLPAIVDIVRYDPGLTAALLRQANSAHSMAARHITDVRDAVVRLGLDTVVSVAMRGAVAASMQDAVELYDLEGGRLYRHAVLAAVAADVLRARRPTLVPAITPTAALLHDIGKLVLSKALGARTTELVSVLSRRDGRPLHTVELEVFGIHHGHAGRYVVQLWKLPTSFLDGIVNHHGDVEEPSVFARAVQFANLLAHAVDERDRTDPRTAFPVPAEIAETFGVDGPAFDALTDLVAARFEAVAASFGG